MSKKLVSEVERALRDIRLNLDLYDEKWQELLTFNQNRISEQHRLFDASRKETMRGKKHAVRTATLELMDYKHVNDAKAKIETDLEGSLRKLHRLRQQLIDWISNCSDKDLRNKEELMEYRKHIELRYKRGKVFYRQGVSSEDCSSNQSTELNKTQRWMLEFVQKLKKQRAGWKEEIDEIGRSKYQTLEEKERVEQLIAMRELHRMNITKLHLLQRALRSNELEAEDQNLEKLHTELEAYIEDNDLLVILVTEELYVELGLNVESEEVDDFDEDSMDGEDPSHIEESYEGEGLNGVKHEEEGSIDVEAVENHSPPLTNGKTEVAGRGSTSNGRMVKHNGVANSEDTKQYNANHTIASKHGTSTHASASCRQSNDEYHTSNANHCWKAEGRMQDKKNHSIVHTPPTPPSQWTRQKWKDKLMQSPPFTSYATVATASSKVTITATTPPPPSRPAAPPLPPSPQSLSTPAPPLPKPLPVLSTAPSTLNECTQEADATSSEADKPREPLIVEHRFVSDASIDTSGPCKVPINTPPVTSYEAVNVESKTASTTTVEAAATSSPPYSYPAQAACGDSSLQTTEHVGLVVIDKAICGWKAYDKNQLSVAARDKLYITTRHSSGWTYGYVLNNGRKSFGWFPNAICRSVENRRRRITTSNIQPSHDSFPSIYNTAYQTAVRRSDEAITNGIASPPTVMYPMEVATSTQYNLDASSYKPFIHESLASLSLSNVSASSYSSPPHRMASVSHPSSPLRDTPQTNVLASPYTLLTMTAPGVDIPPAPEASDPFRVPTAHSTASEDASLPDTGGHQFSRDKRGKEGGNEAVTQCSSSEKNGSTEGGSQKNQTGNRLVSIVHVIPEKVEVQEVRWSWNGELADGSGTLLLKFSKGEKVEILAYHRAGWIFGRIRGEPHRRGWFPEYMLKDPEFIFPDRQLSVPMKWKTTDD